VPSWERRSRDAFRCFRFRWSDVAATLSLATRHPTVSSSRRKPGPGIRLCSSVVPTIRRQLGPGLRRGDDRESEAARVSMLLPSWERRSRDAFLATRHGRYPGEGRDPNDGRYRSIRRTRGWAPAFAGVTIVWGRGNLAACAFVGATQSRRFPREPTQPSSRRRPGSTRQPLPKHSSRGARRRSCWSWSKASRLRRSHEGVAYGCCQQRYRRLADICTSG
jgi:hypothetical protein